jgi:hypothetical protein
LPARRVRRRSREADRRHVLSFAQAQAAARAWLVARARSDKNETESGPSPSATRSTTTSPITHAVAARRLIASKSRSRPIFGWRLARLDIGAISRRRIETCHAKLAETPPRLRTKKGGKQRHRSINSGVEAVRQRRSRANRVLNILKEALNLAHKNRHADAPEVWGMVEPFREVDAAKIRYLTDAKAKRLVNAFPPDFRCTVTAAVFTGARAATALSQPTGLGAYRISNRSPAPRHVGMVPPQFFSGPVHPGSTTIRADRLPVPQGFFKIVIDPATGRGAGFHGAEAAPTKDKAAGETVAIETIIASTGIVLPLPGNVDVTKATMVDDGALADYPSDVMPAD